MHREAVHCDQSQHLRTDGSDAKCKPISVRLEERSNESDTQKHYISVRCAVDPSNLLTRDRFPLLRRLGSIRVPGPGPTLQTRQLPAVVRTEPNATDIHKNHVGEVVMPQITESASKNQCCMVKMSPIPILFLWKPSSIDSVCLRITNKIIYSSPFSLIFS